VRTQVVSLAMNYYQFYWVLLYSAWKCIRWAFH